MPLISALQGGVTYNVHVPSLHEFHKGHDYYKLHVSISHAMTFVLLQLHAAQPQAIDL